MEQDLDGSRFVRGVVAFDLARDHPHPPGYPVYLAPAIALNRLAHTTPGLALSLESLVAYGALVSLVSVLLLRDGRTALATSAGTLVFALGSVVTVHATRPLSDLPGAALAWFIVVLAEPCALDQQRAPTSRNAAVLALTALLTASRLSDLPLVVAVAWSAAVSLRRRPGTLVAAIAVPAVLSWLPVVANTGGRAFVGLVAGHAQGHFTRFGGGVATSVPWHERLPALVHGVWAHLLGGWWIDRSPALVLWSVALVVFLGAGLARRNASAPSIDRGVALYAAWAVLAQNVVWQPRHLMPLAPWFALRFARGVDAFPRVHVRAVAVALSVAIAPLAVESVRLSRVQRDVAPAPVALAEHLAAIVDPETTLVASTQLDGWLRYRAPRLRIVAVRDARSAIAIGVANRRRIVLTSEVPGAPALPRATVLARFRNDRYVTPTLYDLAAIAP